MPALSWFIKSLPRHVFAKTALTPLHGFEVSTTHPQVRYFVLYMTHILVCSLSCCVVQSLVGVNGVSVLLLWCCCCVVFLRAWLLMMGVCAGESGSIYAIALSCTG